MATDQRLRVLIADDYEDSLMLYQSYLAAKGYDVATSTDGATVLRAVQRFEPDAIVLDLGLPNVDGWTLIRNLKADRSTADIPIVVCSAHAMAQERKAAFDAGCDRFVIKPCLPVELEQEVHRAIALVRAGSR